jgi:metal-responsive CopG/Arc/MetJ family transcriptional regulator
MKVKTSITLSEELLEIVDELSRNYKNRSEFIEIALHKFITELIRDEQNTRDIEIINRHADELNAEADDVLSYQAVP